MGGNPFSFDAVMNKKPAKEEKKPIAPMYIPPEQVDFSKVKFDPNTAQIVAPEQNVLQVHPEFKTSVTKKPIKPEEEKAIGDYIKQYDEMQPKAELETNIINPIAEHFTKGIEQVKSGDLSKAGLNLALGVEKTAGAPFAILDQAVRKIPHIGGTVADIVSSPFTAVDEYMKFAGDVNKQVGDFLGVEKPDEETQKLIDDFSRTTAQFVVAPFIIKGLKMGYEKLPFAEKKQVLSDITTDLKERTPEFTNTETILKQGEKPVEGIDKRLQLEPEEPLLNIPEKTPVSEPIVTPEGKKLRGFFTRIKDKVTKTLGKDVRDDILANPESYYEPQKLAEIKANLKDLTDQDLISAMTDEGLQRLPVSRNPKDNIYVLKELERYNRAIGKQDLPLAENIINDLNQLGTPLGQVIRQYREFKSSTPAGIIDLVKRQLDKMNRQLSPEQGKELFKLSSDYFTEYNKLSELDRILKDNYTPENIDARLKQTEIVADKQNTLDQFIYETQPRSIWDTFSTILKGNLLTFNSLTQNPLSNVMLSIPRYSAKLIATPLDYIASKIYGEPRQIRHGFDLLGQMIKDTGVETWDAMKKLWTGDIKTSNGKYEVKQSLKPLTSLKQALTGKNLPLNKNGKVALLDRIQRGIEGTMGVYPEAMFRLLNLGDQPFSKPTYKNALREFGKSKGLKGIDLKKFTEFPDETSRKMAEQEALESVFAQDNRVADWVIRMKYETGKIPVVGRIMKFIADSIVPYVKVPANFVVEVADFMIPALSFSKGIYHFSKGNSRKGGLYIGKAFTGYMMSQLAESLYENGIITGSPSRIEKEKELEFNIKQPNSFNISALRRLINHENPAWQPDDTLISYNKLGILGAFFGVTSDMPKEDKIQNKTMSDEAMETIFGAFTNYPKVLKYAFEQSFLKGTNTLLSTMASGETKDYEKFVQTWFNTIFSVVAPNQLSYITKANLEYMPEKRKLSTIDQLDYLIKERTLQWGAIEKDYPVKIGLYGEKIKQTPSGTASWFYNLFDLTKNRPLEQNPLAKDVLSIYEATDDLDVVPPIPKNTLSYNGQDITLEGRRYQQFKEYVGQERKKLHEALLLNPQYTALTPENKIVLLKQAWDKGYENGKELMFKSEFPQNKKKKKEKKPYLKDFLQMKEKDNQQFYLPRQ